MQAISPDRQPRVKSAERVLDIVEALARDPRGLTFTDLLRVLQLPKSSLHELLRVLTERGYVEYDPASHLYMLGIRVWESGQAYLRHHDLVREALPVMESIVGRINETVQLAILDGFENVYLAKVDSSHPLRLQSEVGRRLHAHATGLGKVLLAHLSHDELIRRLDGTSLPRFTSHTLTDQVQLLEELGRIGERGFALDAQEYTAGLCCVAVPIYHSSSRVIAAMSVSIPVTRADIELFSTALCLLAEGSLRITRRLGGRVDGIRLAQLRDQATARDALAPLFHHLVQR
jgi:DNA-binding IclR family transcriptional regulator